LITKKFKRQELVLVLSHYENQITEKSEHKIKCDQDKLIIIRKRYSWETYYYFPHLEKEVS